MRISDAPADFLHTLLSRPVPATYKPLISQMKFFIEPEVSCSRFFGNACFTEESIHSYRHANDRSRIDLLRRTELGDVLYNRMQGALFIDIPCGRFDVRDHAEDFDIPALASALGADECLEVDADADVLSDRIKNSEDIGVRQEYGLQIMTMRDDLLAYIAQIDRTTSNRPITIYISGMQPDADFCVNADHQHDVIVPYLEALYDELARTCTAKDAIILNSSDMLVAGIDEHSFPFIHPALALGRRGFTLLRRCPLNKVQVFCKDT